jgi:hypothetical protein
MIGKVYRIVTDGGRKHCPPPLSNRFPMANSSIRAAAIAVLGIGC